MRYERLPALLLVFLAVQLPLAGGAETPPGVEGAVLSHPPMRPLPRPSTREMGAGPALFVDPLAGDDSGPGTLEEPWKSLRHAVTRLEPGETLYLRQGIYFETLRLELRGGERQPITLRAYPGELAVVDGGLREFLEDPSAAWEPVVGGSSGEYRSTRSHSGIAEPQGFFADSMVPLHSYRRLEDLRSDNELWVSHEAPRFCGPGLWLDPTSNRLHIRLAHVGLTALAETDRYRGETDPRNLPLVIGGGSATTLQIEDSRRLRIQDLVFRGGGASTIEIEDSADIELEGISVYSGRGALVLEGVENLRITQSVFRGTSAPWSFRSSHKYRGVPGILLSTTGLVGKSRNLEISHSEFTDGHDGVFLGETQGVSFHHNLVENFNDDGIFLTARLLGGQQIHIHENRIGRCLTTFAFGWGRGRPNLPGSGVYVYRNVVELIKPVQYFPPRPDRPPAPQFFGRVCADHGSPVWEPMFLYHNTFVARGEKQRSYAMGWGSHLQGTFRRLFNNVMVLIDVLPGQAPPSPELDFQADGNLYWSAVAVPAPEDDFLAAFRKSAAFEASKRSYPPGWENASLWADPRFISMPRGEDSGDYRLQEGSPAIDAGVPLPDGLPDPLAAADAGAPDVGALPFGLPAPQAGKVR